MYPSTHVLRALGLGPQGFQAVAAPGHYDEVHDPLSGGLRPAWQQFFAHIEAAQVSTPAVNPSDGWAAWVARQILDNGVTYNTHHETRPLSASSLPWQLGVLPLLMAPDDWANLVPGLVQRARLMAAISADVYGPQTLIRGGLLPAALVWGHPAYMRALHGVRPVGDLFLHFCAFDLARGPDGRWWVVDQHVQTPSGLGYMLENRLIISHLFPHAFRGLRVQHLASGYRHLLETLMALAAPLAQGSKPRVVLLTPGYHADTYFEQAYIARYLGLSLVEGADLTMRDGGMFLKTLQGLEPVHGVLRWVDDVYCDPLELHPDAHWGVPGLLQAVRAGRVMLANPLGTGFLESPGLQGFLPGVCEALLGERLQLPSVPTWWCGESAARQAIRPTLGQQWIRASYASSPRHFATVRAPALSTEALTAWQERIDRDPDAHTVQDVIAFSQVPLWQGQAWLARTATVRVYTVVDPQGHWHVLPGGMTRVAMQDPHGMSMHRGGSSMDTWVMNDEAAQAPSAMPLSKVADELTRRYRPVTSRPAENLFWMGRYTERMEHLVRLTQSCESLVDDDDDMPASVLQAMSVLARSCGLVPYGAPALTDDPKAFERVVIRSLADAQAVHGARSVAWNLRALRHGAQGLRERLSPEHWRLLHAMDSEFTSHIERAVGSGGGDILGLGAATLQDALSHLAMQLAAVTGAQSDRMTRDDGWRLLTVGRLIERLVLMTEVLYAFARGTHPGMGDVDSLQADMAQAAQSDTRFPPHQPQVAPGEDLGGGSLEPVSALCTVQGVDLVLGLFDSTITYRARYQHRTDLLALMDLVLFDEANPRALACVLHRLRTQVSQLPTVHAGTVAMTAVTDLLAHLPPTGVGLKLDAILNATGRHDAMEMQTLGEPSPVSTHAAEVRQHAAGRRLSLQVQGLAAQLHAAGVSLAADIDRRYFAHADGSDRMLTL